MYWYILVMQLRSTVKIQDLITPEKHIPDAVTSGDPTLVEYCEFVPDAYEAILAAEKEGLITILRYKERSKAQLEWVERTIREEYENAVNQPEYRHFIEGKFPFVRR